MNEDVPDLYSAKEVVVNAQGETGGNALWVDQGRIRAVGDFTQLKREFKAHRGRAPRIKTWDASVLFPTFTDCHAHLLAWAQTRVQSQRLDLSGSNSSAVVLLRLQEFARRNPGLAVIEGWGWDQEKWGEELPVRFIPGELTQGRPVLLHRIDLHAVWVNDAVGALLGTPKGLLLEKEREDAVERVRASILPWEQDSLRSVLLEAQNQLLNWGLAQVHDAWVSDHEWEILQALAQEPNWKLRVRAYRVGEIHEVPPHLGSRVVFGGWKGFADGALGSRGAALSQPYTDAPDQKGQLLLHPDLPHYLDWVDASANAVIRGEQLAWHAIGDAAVSSVLDFYERVKQHLEQKLGKREGVARWEQSVPRIEHAQVVQPRDRLRMAQLKTVASVQPIHAVEDRDWAHRRLGDLRMPWAYAWRSLADAGVVLAGGSDAPVGEAHPWSGILAAQELGGLTRSESLALYTTGAAFAGKDARSGELRPGFLPYFQVLGVNPVTCSNERLKELTQMQKPALHCEVTGF